MSGWGGIPWGGGSWGGGTPVGIAYAFAAGDRFVRVGFTAAPLMGKSTRDGDALNPRTWMIYRTDASRFLTVLSVAQFDSTTIDILTLEQFDSHLISMTVGAHSLRDSSGGLITPAVAFDFAGALLENTSTPQKVATSRGFGLRDLHNPPTPNSPLGGTLEITAAGDYASVEGTALLRKLVVRRIITAPGDFFHLPDYGVGLRSKELLPAADLPALKARIEQQIRREPDVEDVTVKLVGTDNMLTVLARVRQRRTGQEVVIDVPLAGVTIAF
jgi:hypothetical protein